MCGRCDRGLKELRSIKSMKSMNSMKLMIEINTYDIGLNLEIIIGKTMVR